MRKYDRDGKVGKKKKSLLKLNLKGLAAAIGGAHMYLVDD